MAKEPNEVTVWEPFGMITPLREAMNNLLEDSFVNPARFDPLIGRAILMDVFETPAEYTIEATLPGVKPEDVKVSATADTITIRAHTKRETHEAEKGAYVRRERREGEMTRSITLATPIDPERITADYEHGILKLTAPKVKVAEPHQISVKVH